MSSRRTRPGEMTATRQMGASLASSSTTPAITTCEAAWSTGTLAAAATWKEIHPTAPAHGMDKAKMPEVMPQETVLPRASQKQTATIQKQPIQAPSTVRASGDTASVTATTSRLTQVSTIRTRVRMRKARNCRRKPPRRSHHSRRTGAPSRFNEDAAERSVEGDAGAAGGAWGAATGATTGADLAGPVPVVGCSGLVVACAGMSPYCPVEAGPAAGAGGTAPTGTPPDDATRP